MRRLTGLVSVASLLVAAVTWVVLSRPFDPPRLVALTVPATVQSVQVPRYAGVITVLTYHAVSDQDQSASTLTRRHFAEHMATLAALGFHTVRLAQVADVLAHRPVRLPDRPLLLTFDDGSVTDWTTVDPVLEAYHFTAVAFLVTARVVDPGTPSYYLSTRQVRAMRDTGRWEFGSHTHDLHSFVPVPGDIQPALTNRILIRDNEVGDSEESMEGWRRRVSADLAESQRFFTHVLGRPVTAFAYPFGEAGAMSELPALVQRAGFGFAFTGENVPTGHLDAVGPDTPRWTVPRIGVRSTTSVADLMRMIVRATPTDPPSDPSTLHWAGKCVAAQGQVTVTPVGGKAAMCVTREVNTSQWRNYTADVRFAGVDRHSTAVIGVRDGTGAGHYGRIEVAVGESRIAIRQQIGAARPVQLAAAPKPPGNHIRIQVRGNEVIVTPLLKSHVDGRLYAGGISFSVIGDKPHAVRFTTSVTR